MPTPAVLTPRSTRPVAPAGEEANHAAAPWVALAALRHAGAARRAAALPVAPLHHAAAQAIRVDPLTLPRRGPGLTPRGRNVALNCTDEPLVGWWSCSRFSELFNDRAEICSATGTFEP